MVSKAHMTVSVGRDLYDRIRRHPEVKWSQAARQGILEKLSEVEGFMKGEDFLNSLPAETKHRTEEIALLPKKDWEKYLGKEI